MRVAVDARTLSGRFTGDRTYWANLLPAIATRHPDVELELFSRLPLDDSALEPAPNLRVNVLPARNDRLWSMLAFPGAVRRARADVAHVQYTVPPWLPCPAVTTVHDISFRLHPEWFPPRHRFLLNRSIPGSMRRAARVITVSHSSRADILAQYRLPPAKVVAIPHGVPGTVTVRDPDEALAEQELHRTAVNTAFGFEGPYILALGVLQPRKNLRMLVQAYGAAVAQGLGQSLVLAGKAGWATGEADLRDLAALHGGDAARDRLVFTGYVPDASLAQLYGGADIFAYPSLYEGFGLPPLEAMACGTATVVSDRPALPEVVGDAARIVPAEDTRAWTAVLVELGTDERERQALARRGPVRAAGFRWEDAADATYGVYKQAAGGS